MDGFLGTEEYSVLRFWESPSRDNQGLLSALLPAGDEEMIQQSPEPSDPMQGFGQTMSPADAESAVGGVAGGGVALSETVALIGGGGDVPATPVGSPLSEITSPGGPAWVQYDGSFGNCCSCCLLRDVVHADDQCRIRLSVHGNLGMIQHAILVIHYFAREMMDEVFIAELSSFHAASVKHFLEQYSNSCCGGGLKLVQDTYYNFYDVLSVSMDYTEPPFPAAAASLYAHRRGERPVFGLPPLQLPQTALLEPAGEEVPLPPPAITVPLAAEAEALAHRALASLDPTAFLEHICLPHPTGSIGASSSRARQPSTSGEQQQGVKRRQRK